jgi:glycogen debranching enzyme
VWPHDNGLIAAGLARYGDKQRAAQLFAAMFDSASYMELRRFPELFCGFVRRKRNGPTQYPVACAPHAWATASFVCMLQATLGLKICAGGAKSPVERLSEREFEVFVRLAAGATVQRIAQDLNLSASTIGTHLYNIKQKLGVVNQS